MGLALREERISVANYLAGEEKAEERHVFADGAVYAMAGATEQHEIISGNLFATILAHLRGKGCRVFKGDMKIRLKIQTNDLFYYPDIMVVCDPTDDNPLFKQRPKVIVEVMSDFKSDHVEKVYAYGHIESLEEYVVIHQEPSEARAWIYRRSAGWEVSDAVTDGQLRIDSLDFTTPLRDLYHMA
jgi:Uma2 family endonuclease